MFWILLFNFANYVFLMSLYILTVTLCYVFSLLCYVLFVMNKERPTKCICKVNFENAFRWSFFHHNLKMHGPSCKLLFVSLNILIVMYVPFCVFCLIVLFCVLFVCKCVLSV
jgi:hypothetical protein